MEHHVARDERQFGRVRAGVKVRGRVEARLRVRVKVKFRLTVRLRVGRTVRIRIYSCFFYTCLVLSSQNDVPQATQFPTRDATAGTN
jgi:hypothetical protein